MIFTMGGGLQASESTIRYFDCTTPQKRHELDISSACTSRNTPDQTSHTEVHTIIQQRPHHIYPGFICTVQRSSFTVYCGAFSHLKLIQIPEIEVSEVISGDVCYTAARKGKYRDHTGRDRTVTLGSTTIWTTNDLGSLHDQDGTISCAGEDAKISGTLVHQVLRLSQYKVTIKRDQFLVQGNDVEAIMEKTKLPSDCLPATKICQSDVSTYIMNVTPQCQFDRIQDTRLVSEDGYLVDHQKKLIFKKKASHNFQPSCGSGEYVETEYRNIYLTRAHNLRMEAVQEIDISIYLNSRSDYLMFQVEKMIGTMTNTLQTDACSHQIFSKKGDNEIFRLRNGEFGLQRGDVLSVFDCETKTATISKTGSCFDKIPIVGGNFVDPKTKLLSSSATEVACNERFPLVVRAEEGNWLTIGPGVSHRKSPENVSVLPTEEHSHEDFAAGGIYSSDEMQSWQNHISWGDYKESLSETTAMKACAADPRCQGPSQPDRSYLTGYYNEVESLDPLADIKTFVSEYGALASFIVLTKWTVETVVGIVLTILTYTRLGFRAARMAFQAMFCFHFNAHSKVKRRWGRYQPAALLGRRDIEEEKDVEDQYSYPTTARYTASPARGAGQCFPHSQGDSEVNIQTTSLTPAAL